MENTEKKMVLQRIISFIIIFIFVFTTIFAMAGCGSESESADASGEAAEDEEMETSEDEEEVTALTYSDGFTEETVEASFADPAKVGEWFKTPITEYNEDGSTTTSTAYMQITALSKDQDEIESVIEEELASEYVDESIDELPGDDYEYCMVTFTVCYGEDGSCYPYDGTFMLKSEDGHTGIAFDGEYVDQTCTYANYVYSDYSAGDTYTGYFIYYMQEGFTDYYLGYQYYDEYEDQQTAFIDIEGIGSPKINAVLELDNGETAVEATAENPAQIGEWFKSSINGSDGGLHTVFIRINSISNVEDTVNSAISDRVYYWGDDTTELYSDDYEYLVISYDVYFPEDLGTVYSIGSWEFKLANMDGTSYLYDYDIILSDDASPYYEDGYTITAGGTYTEGCAIIQAEKGSDYLIEMQSLTDGYSYIYSYIQP